jgi:hypothetical protein
VALSNAATVSTASADVVNERAVDDKPLVGGPPMRAAAADEESAGGTGAFLPLVVR